MMHTFQPAAPIHVDLAEIGLGLAWMPHQVEVPRLAFRGELAPKAGAVLVTVDSDTSAPFSSRSRSHTRVAVCRCLCHVSRSSASHCSIAGTYSSIADARRFLTGGLGDRSPASRYLRTVGSPAPTFLAIDAMDSPFLLNWRID